MDSDTKIQQYLLLAKSTRGRSTAELILQAAAEPGVFTFGELLDHPAVRELENGEFAAYVDLLKLFAYGTWPQFKAASVASAARPLPQITSQHELKLKQLTVVSMATQSKVIPYTELKAALDISEVRDLEDFVISGCFYSGLLKGCLDQKAACLHVTAFSSRDLRPEQLHEVVSTLQNWTSTSQGLMEAIEQRIQAAVQAAEATKQNREAVEGRIEEVKKALQKAPDLDARMMADSMMLDEGLDAIMDEERSLASLSRPKRRR